jgi:hypothetical protein
MFANDYECMSLRKAVVSCTHSDSLASKYCHVNHYENHYQTDVLHHDTVIGTDTMRILAVHLCFFV